MLLFIYDPIVCHRDQINQASTKNQNRNGKELNPISSGKASAPGLGFENGSPGQMNDNNEKETNSTNLNVNESPSRDEENPNPNDTEPLLNNSKKIEIKGKNFVEFQAKLNEMSCLPIVTLFFALLLSLLALLAGKL